MIVLLQDTIKVAVGQDFTVLITAANLVGIIVVFFKLGSFKGSLDKTLEALRRDIVVLADNDKEQSKTLAHHGEALAALQALKTVREI